MAKATIILKPWKLRSHEFDRNDRSDGTAVSAPIVWSFEAFHESGPGPLVPRGQGPLLRRWPWPPRATRGDGGSGGKGAATSSFQENR